MIELGELERHHDAFAARNTQVVVASMEGAEDARQTQTQHPHLLVLADASQGLSKATATIHPHGGMHGEDIDAPTTILLDRQGTVRWLYRPGSAFSRLSSAEVLQAVDDKLPKQ